MVKGNIWLQGFRDGVPIAMGYYAVAFSLGIIAASCGLTPVMGFISSFLTRASAGEYGVYSLMAVGAGYPEVVGIALVANARYLLMSASFSQKIAPATSTFKRIIAACCMTDEVFGISISYPGKTPVAYPVAATLISGVAWAAGTASGIIAGNMLSADIVAALSVALYGMFLAIIIPPAKRDRAVLWCIIASFLLSTLFAVLPLTAAIGYGTRTIILTILISTVAAIVKPINVDDDEQ